MDVLVEGDRARVVLEGRVTYASDSWVSIEDEHGFEPREPRGIVSVTKLALLLPVVHGSVILEAPHGVYYLVDGGWRSITSHATFRSDWFDPNNITVLHDAGAVA